MKKFKTKKLLSFLLIVFSFSFLWPIKPVFGINNCNDGWQVNVGETKQIDCHGVCKKVTNNCGHPIFVPTKTSGEWVEFRVHHPACVSLVECLPPLIFLPACPFSDTAGVWAGIIDAPWSGGNCFSFLPESETYSPNCRCLLGGSFCFAILEGTLNIVETTGPFLLAFQDLAPSRAKRAKLCKVGDNPIGIPQCPFSGGERGYLYVTNRQFFCLGYQRTDPSIWLKVSSSEKSYTTPEQEFSRCQRCNFEFGNKCKFSVKVWPGSSDSYLVECWVDGYTLPSGWQRYPNWCEICYVP